MRIGFLAFLALAFVATATVVNAQDEGTEESSAATTGAGSTVHRMLFMGKFFS